MLAGRAGAHRARCERRCVTIQHESLPGVISDYFLFTDITHGTDHPVIEAYQ
jgi:hypothetical protein